MSARTMKATAHTRALGAPVQFDPRYTSAPEPGAPISRIVWQDADGEIQETVLNSATDGSPRDFLVSNGVDIDNTDLYGIERIGWARR